MRTKRLLALAATLAAIGLVTATAFAQRAQPAPASPRIYIFDNGAIIGPRPRVVQLQREELKEADFVNASYLVVHPRGTFSSMPAPWPTRTSRPTAARSSKAS